MISCSSPFLVRIFIVQWSITSVVKLARTSRMTSSLPAGSVGGASCSSLPSRPRPCLMRCPRTSRSCYPRGDTAVEHSQRRSQRSLGLRLDRRKEGWPTCPRTPCLPEANVMRIYGKRWDIVIFFRTAKQFLGLEKGCHAREFDSLIVAHAHPGPGTDAGQDEPKQLLAGALLSRQGRCASLAKRLTSWASMRLFVK